MLAMLLSATARPALKTEFFTALSAAQGLTIGDTHALVRSRQPSFQAYASARGVIPEQLLRRNDQRSTW